MLHSIQMRKSINPTATNCKKRYSKRNCTCKTKNIFVKSAAKVHNNLPFIATARILFP